MLEVVNEDIFRKKRFLSLYLDYADRYLPLHRKRNLNICDIFTITISESGEVIFNSSIIEELQDIKFKMVVDFNQITVDRPKQLVANYIKNLNIKLNMFKK